MHAFVLRHTWKPAGMQPAELEAFRWASPVVPVNEYVYESRDKRTWAAFHEIPTRLFPDGACFERDDSGVTFFDGHIWPVEPAGNLLPGMAAFLRKELKAHTADTLRSAVNGEYALVHVDEDSDTITAFSDAVGVCALYVLECADGFIVSNRLFAIKALAPDAGVEYDLDALAYLATWGLIPPRRTVYQKIQEVGAGCVLQAKGGTVAVARNPRPYHDLPGCEGLEVSSAAWDRAVAELASNLRFLHLCPDIYPQLGLSGGKDSRLILAAALHEGVARNILLMTQGLDSHPDVIVAKEITEHYELPHRIVRPTDAGPIDTIKIFDEAMPAHMWITEGMLNVYDPHGRKRAGADPMLSGLNGECFRSNYDRHGHKSHGVTDAKSAMAFFEKAAPLNLAGLVRDEWVASHRSARQEWVDTQLSLGIPAEDLPTLQYTSFQSLRRNGNARKVNGYWQHTINVLNGNTMYWLALHIGAEARRREQLHFELMRRMAPWLVEHRFANQSWHKKLFPNYPPPKPCVATAQEKSAFQQVDWRTHINTDPKFKQHVMDFVLNVPASSDFWRIVDRGKIEAYFREREHSHMSRFHFFGAITIAMAIEGRRREQGIEPVQGFAPVFVRNEATDEVFVACQGEIRKPSEQEAVRAAKNPAAVFPIAPEVIGRFRNVVDNTSAAPSDYLGSTIIPVEGFHRPESAHVWLEKRAVFRFEGDRGTLAFSLAPPPQAIAQGGVVEVEVRNAGTDDAFQHRFTAAQSKRFVFRNVDEGHAFTITASHDFCPADTGGGDTRRLALKFFAAYSA